MKVWIWVETYWNGKISTNKILYDNKAHLKAGEGGRDLLWNSTPSKWRKQNLAVVNSVGYLEDALFYSL